MNENCGFLLVYFWINSVFCISLFIFRLPKGDKKKMMDPKSLVQLNPLDSTLMLLKPTNTPYIANPPGNCITMSNVDVTRFSFEVDSFWVVQGGKEGGEEVRWVAIFISKRQQLSYTG